jgi:arylsulfatase A-like enzyme
MAKPNILIINVDGMRGDFLGAHTPNLSRLTEEGVSFSNAFCQNPVCVPSRISFMTGLYPHTLGHRTQGHLLRPNEETLFSDLKGAGYYTASTTRGDLFAGQYEKFHKQNIDEYINPASPKKRPKLNEITKPPSQSGCKFFEGVVNNAFSDDALTALGAVKFIKKRAKNNKPFFAFVAFNLTHPPYKIEQGYLDSIDKTNLPPKVRGIEEGDGKPKMEQGLLKGLGVDGNEKLVDDIRAIYASMCNMADSLAGQIINALKDSRIYDKTAVFLFADHGDYTGDFGLVEKAQNCFPDCLTRVPLIIKPPKNVAIEAGINESLAELIDIPATILEIAGVETKRTMFSKSLLPSIENKAKKHRDFVCCEGGRLKDEVQASEIENLKSSNAYTARLTLQQDCVAHGKATMLRTDKYKYIRRLYENDEFYELAKGESINLINEPQYSLQIAEMQKQMLNWYMETCDVVPNDIDSRQNLAHIKNGLIMLGLPRLLAKIATAFLRIFLKITRQTPSGFLGKLEKKVNS